MTARVLGTRLVDLSPPAERWPTTLIVSDLHVPAAGGPVIERLQAWLDVAAQSRARLFVLGDLFDALVSPRQVDTGIWREVADRCAAAVAAGAELTVLHGNRDFLLGRRFAAHSGARVIAGGVRTTLAGRPALLLHGDELCRNDLPYQRAKRWLRSPLVRALAWCLPLATASRVAARARQRSKTVTATGDPARFEPTIGAVAAAFATGVDLLVFGHIHRPARGRTEAGEYCVLPAFDEHGIGLWIADRSVHYAAVFSGQLQRCPDPAPRAFAADR